MMGGIGILLEEVVYKDLHVIQTLVILLRATPLIHPALGGAILIALLLLHQMHVVIQKFMEGVITTYQFKPTK